jgi:hypothetical protein
LKNESDPPKETSESILKQPHRDIEKRPSERFTTVYWTISVVIYIRELLSSEPMNEQDFSEIYFLGRDIYLTNMVHYSIIYSLDVLDDSTSTRREETRRRGDEAA